MKIYTILREKNGNVVCRVRGSLNELSRPIKRIVFHSPTGFETGYSGSGPADLALSILADYFGIVNPVNISIDNEAWKYHQRFKDHFIAPQKLEPCEAYEILAIEISTWVTETIRATI